MKRIIMVVLLIVALTCSGVFAVSNRSASNKPNLVKIDYEEIISDSYFCNTESAISVLDETDDNGNILVHNNGNAMETDVFANGESGGNYLIGVFITNEGAGKVEHYYFSNGPEGNEGSLKVSVSDTINKMANDVMPTASSSSIIREQSCAF